MTAMSPSSSSSLRERVLERFLRQPLIGPMISHPVLGRALAAGALGQIIFSSVGVTLLDCPVPQLFHIPCPGCGLTTAVLHLLKGHPLDALRIHAFAPVILIALVLLMVGSVLSGDARLRFGGKVAAFERAGCVPALALVSIHFYWLARLVYLPHT